MIQTLKEWLVPIAKMKSIPSFAMIRLAQISFQTLHERSDHLNEKGILTTEALDEMLASYQKLLLSACERCLKKPEKLRDDKFRVMVVECALDAFEALEISATLKDTIVASLKPLGFKVRDTNPLLGVRFEMILMRLAPASFNFKNVVEALVGGDILSNAGRRSIQKRIGATMKNISEPEKLELSATLLQRSLEDSGNHQALLALSLALPDCEGLFSLLTQFRKLTFDRLKRGCHELK
jgi:hypothetical protein